MKIASIKKEGRPPKQKDQMDNVLPDPKALPAVPKESMAPKAATAPVEQAGAAEPSEGEKAHMMQVLMDAHDIKSDPVKMAHVEKHMSKQMGKMKSIQDIKDYAQIKAKSSKGY